jgi:hypothetical protein
MRPPTPARLGMRNPTACAIRSAGTPAVASHTISRVAMIAWAYPGGGMIERTASGLISYRCSSADIIAVRSSSVTTEGMYPPTASELMPASYRLPLPCGPDPRLHRQLAAASECEGSIGGPRAATLLPGPLIERLAANLMIFQARFLLDALSPVRDLAVGA